MTRLEKIAKILELADIPYAWLKRDKNGTGISLSLEDDSSTVSLLEDGRIRIFVSSDVSFSTFEEDDIGDALRIIMEVRYMQRVDGAPKHTEHIEDLEWVE